MEYRISKVPTLGEGFPLHHVAVSLAYADANDKGGFIESVYEKRLEEHISRLVREAHTGNLEVTARDGMRGTMEQIVSYAQTSGYFLSIDDTNIAEALVAFTFLPMLNKWGERFGYSFVFAEHDSHAEILEGTKQFSLGGTPRLSPTHDYTKITSQNDTPHEVIANKLKHETSQKVLNLSTDHTSHMSMALKRKLIIDENKFRGARRLIIENWDNVENLHGDTADGHKVLRILKRNDLKLKVNLKTIQNLLITLRKEGLIP